MSAVRILPSLCLLPALLCAFGAAPAWAAAVACHVTYGGETHTLPARPVSSPYPVRGVAIGSYFHFRPVLQDAPAEHAALKVYTYADRDDGPVLIHQATFPYPPAPGGRAPYGFSGLHHVYEPLRDGELQYWCEMAAEAKA
ncbi:MAG: hypothetical protein OSW77_15820 [Proteobacteria bacterium]|nr:hypothetical protein [Pseudomonadota bacterium]